MTSDIGLYGLAVMGQNLALNIAEKGFSISVHNRSEEKVHATIKRSKEEGKGNFKLEGYTNMKDFLHSLKKPRRVILLVQAGPAVDETIKHMLEFLEKDDAIIDGGNEFYSNTEARIKLCNGKGILYMGMGVSGGEEGARFGPSLMPGGNKEVYDSISHILKKIAAQVQDGPCVTFIGSGGAGNYVKMIHNGIEYGDMQLIAEAYDLLKNIGGCSNKELAEIFNEWNQSELKSFLIEITSKIFLKKEEEEQYVIDKILDKSGSKGTGLWTVQESATRLLASPTISSALDQRFISTLKNERVEASKILTGPFVVLEKDKKKFIQDVKNALYASKIISYTQGMNIIKKASEDFKWNLDLGEISRIWKGGCIIRADFLDHIKSAYSKNSSLKSLLLDEYFSKQINERQESWRRIITISVMNGVPCQALSASLAYYDSYRRDRLPANLIQAQRDFFGAHTFERIDKSGNFHVEWSKL